MSEDDDHKEFQTALQSLTGWTDQTYVVKSGLQLEDKLDAYGGSNDKIMIILAETGQSYREGKKITTGLVAEKVGSVQSG